MERIEDFFIFSTKIYETFLDYKFNFFHNSVLMSKYFVIFHQNTSLVIAKLYSEI